MNRRPRIAIVTHSYPSFDGDWRSNFIEALARAYGEDADVTVFVPYVKTWRRENETPSRVKVVCYRYLPWRSWHTLGVEPLMKGDLSLNVSKMFALPFLVLVGIATIARAMKKERFDMVQAHWAVPNAFIALAARLLAGARETKVFSSSPGSDVTVMSGLGKVGRLLGMILGRCDYLSCNSRDLKEDLCKVGIAPERIDLVIYGVDSAKTTYSAEGRATVRLRLGIDDQTPVLLMVGRFVAKKGFSLAFEALPKIVAQVPNTVLIVVGDGPLAPDYRAILAANGCAGSVRFAGIVPLSELGGYYSACDVFLMPSRRLPSDGLNVVVPEAMACGRPVVASNIGGNDLVVFEGMNGFLHGQDDASLLAARTVELLQNEEKRTTMGAASLRLVKERFDWSAIARHYLNELHSLQEGGHA